jgi:hypothetical protein
MRTLLTVLLSLFAALAVVAAAEGESGRGRAGKRRRGRQLAPPMRSDKIEECRSERR